MLFTLPTTAKQEARADMGKRRRGGDSEASRVSTAADAGLEDILERLERLEKLSVAHDDLIRGLDGHLSTTWLAKEDNPLASVLLTQQKEWNAARPSKGGHPWGPPRRCLTMKLFEWMQASGHKLSEDSAWVKLHKGFTDQRQIELMSMNMMSVKGTKDKRILIKMRPHREAEAAWQEAITAITVILKQDGGERKREAAPMGPLIREVRSQLNQ
eukprot:TRINITY_DN24448_c0_g1_i1.p2 TRINITY_DN24448_c0_g1~~TRINITY_DN24448_c0_g1_i1.p2  ORF type:complete len:214 (+),score=38.25 TRINITY_DN24448_c0_g1_i1:106-747(+)